MLRIPFLVFASIALASPSRAQQVDAISREFTIWVQDAQAQQTDAISREITIWAQDAQAQQLDAISREFTVRLPMPDLVTANITTPPAGLTGQTFQLTWEDFNFGETATTTAFKDKVVRSTDTTLGNADDVSYGEFTYSQILAVGQGVQRTQTLTYPSTAGTYYIFVTTNSDAAQVELDASNNTILSGVFTVQDANPAKPDLVPSITLAPSGIINSGQQVSLTYRVTNSGAAPTNAPQWRERVYLTTNGSGGVSGGTLLGTFDNVSFLAVGQFYERTVALTLPSDFSGTRYLAVEADAQSQLVESNEGNNTVFSASFNVALEPQPDLVVDFPTQPPLFVQSGTFLDATEFTWIVRNQGAGVTNAGSWTESVYLSNDSNPGPSAGDLFLGTSTYSGGILAPTQEVVRSGSFFLPVDLQGDFFVKVYTDSSNAISEFGGALEGNNWGVRNQPPADPRAHVILSLTPDLSGASVTPSGAGPFLAGHGMTFSWSCADLHPGATTWETSIQWVDRIYVSSDSSLDAGDTLLWSASQTASVQGSAWNGTSYTKTASAQLSQSLTAGTWRLIAWIDADTDVFEFDSNYAAEGNNQVVSAPFTVVVQPTDLQVTAGAGANPTTGAAGTSVSLSFDVQNHGPAPTNASQWVDRVYLSSNATLGAGDPVVASATHNGVLGAAPAAYSVTVGGTVPLVAPGDYFLIFACDDSGGVWEIGAENNNTFTLPFTVSAQSANLRASLVNAPEAVGAGGVLTVGWRVSNVGSLATPSSLWNDQVWLSLDATLGAGDLALGSKTHGATLAQGAYYEDVGSFQVPLGTTGLFYVIVKADGGSQVFEGDESDNTAYDRVQIQVTAGAPPNLVVDSMSAASAVVAGQPLAVAWTVRNAGAGPTATTQWSDSVYLSLDQGLDTATDVYLGALDHAGHLAPSETYASATTFIVPVGLAGSYFAIVRTNSNAALVESSVLDDVRSAPTLTVVTLPPNCDLRVTSITHSPTVDAGDLLDVTWVTTNLSGSSMSGSWTDALFLSSDAVLDGGDRLLGQVIGTAPSLPVGGTHQRTAQVRMPGILPGMYRLLVRSDTFGQIPESAETNNDAVSTGFVDCTYPGLVPLPPPGNTLALDLPTGVDQYVRIDAPPGAAVRLTLEHANPSAWTELYASSGSVPSPGVAEFQFERPGFPEQTIVIPAASGQPYFVLARAVFGASTPSAQIRAELLPFEITTVTPPAVGRGRVTLQLEGSQLNTLSSVSLRQRGGTEVHTALDVEILGPTRALALFDLGSATTGTFDVLAQGNGIATVPSAVAVEDARPFEARLALSVAPSIKKGSSGSGSMRMSGAGNVNTPWTLLVLGKSPDPLALVAASDLGLSRLEPGAVADSAVFLVDDLGPSQDVDVALQIAIDALYAPTIPAADLPLVLTGRALSDADYDALVAATSESLRQRVLADPQSGAGILARANAPAIWSAATVLPPDASDVHLPATQPLTGRDLVIALANAAAAGLSDTVPTTSIDAVLGDLACAWLGATGFPCTDLAQAGCLDGIPSAEVTQVQGGNVPRDTACIDVPTSDDPNEKTAPHGFGSQGLVAAGDGLTYRVYFENVASAAAPAALVRIEDELEPGLIASTFRAKRLKFGDVLVELPDLAPNYSNVLDYSATLGVKLQVVAGVDAATNTAFWIMQSLDPVTNLPIADGVRGFLPPNTSGGAGSGFVEFVASTPGTVATGTGIRNRAGVKFDVNPTLPTNQVSNTLDADDPSSGVIASAVQGDDFALVLDWNGSDPPGGAGLESFTVYASTDGGPFAPLITDTETQQRIFHGQPGRTYRFYSRARDRVGRREPIPPVPDLIVTMPPDCNSNGVGDPTDLVLGTSLDCDGNTVPDECQPNADGDTAIDACDGCPTDPAKTVPGVCGCGVSETDSDGDVTPDCQDGCPFDPTKTQPGQCGCGAIETDTDGDGVADCIDNCNIPNEDQADCDGDGIGDKCQITIPGRDCNLNGVLDVCDIAAGNAKDLNLNGVPDECEPPAPIAFCLPGQGGVSPCPCGNPPVGSDRGCNNSANTGGARLTATGLARLSSDTLVFHVDSTNPNSVTIYLQGTIGNPTGSILGDGVRCAAGALKRLGLRTNSMGASSYPGPAEPSVSQRSAALGDPLALGSTRWYQAYYRDVNPTFGCPAPANYNLSGGLRVVWGP